MVCLDSVAIMLFTKTLKLTVQIRIGLKDMKVFHPLIGTNFSQFMRNQVILIFLLEAWHKMLQMDA